MRLYSQGMSAGLKHHLLLNHGSHPSPVAAGPFIQQSSCRCAPDVQMSDSSPVGVLLIHSIEELQKASTDVAGDFTHHPCRHMLM